MPTPIAVAVAITVFLFLAMLTTTVTVVMICIHLKKKNFKIEEDKQSVEHIYDAIDGFSNIQALHDPKHNLEAMNSQSLDVQMINMQSNAAYDVVGRELQPNMAYRVVAVGCGHENNLKYDASFTSPYTK